MHFGVHLLHATIVQDRQEQFSIGCFPGGGLSPAPRQVLKTIEFLALRLIGHELLETFLNAKGLGGGHLEGWLVPRSDPSDPQVLD